MAAPRMRRSIGDLGRASPAHGAGLALQQWRSQVAQAAALADNDAVAACDKLAGQVSELTERYALESKQRHIDALVLRNTRQQAELDRQRMERYWLWSVLAGVACITVCILACAIRLRMSRRLVAELNAGLERQVMQRTAELRRQKRYLRTLIDTLPFSVWFKDTLSCYLAVNRSFAAHHAGDSAAIIGKDDRQLRPAMAARWMEEDRQVMASRRTCSTETLQVGADGKCWTEETFKAPVIDDDGDVLGTVGFAVDISTRKHADQAREAALAEAQRQARLRSDFLAQMSHELRTPLNAILGYAQLLRGDESLGLTQRTAAGVMCDSGEHLLTMINDLLDSAKIDAGKVELRKAPLKLRQSLQTMADMVRVRATKKRLASPARSMKMCRPWCWRTNSACARPCSTFWPTPSNLPTGGRSACACGPCRTRGYASRCSIPAPASAASSCSAFFYLFEQAGSRAQRQGGTGLGLSMSRRFVQLMGGEIVVDSMLGCGCHFWFKLDLPSVATPADFPASRSPAHAAAAEQLAPLVALPPGDMAALHRLAQLGNMQDILEYAARLERIDACHASFVTQVRRLAQGYESRAVLELFEQYRDTNRSG